MRSKVIFTNCCIGGGGPAGIMLGYLLARRGIDVTVLEKWPDFFRDFRGDTIHPSTMEILSELGLLEDFLKLPHDTISQIKADIGKHEVHLADFSHLKVHSPFIALIPQWDFLNFISDKAKKYYTFHLQMETEVIDLIWKGEKVIGVKARNKDGDFDIYSKLVIGADGRSSKIREKSNLIPKTYSAPMDVLWFRISRKENDSASVFGRVDMGKIIIMLNRKEYWQCGLLIRKGEFENIKKMGIEAFRKNIIEIMPMLNDRAPEIQQWDQIKLLTVTVDYLHKWYCEGLLCIGDSAHAMSPIGGVGINLAIQDAVAAANILAPAFLNNVLSQNVLARIQKRRMLPVRFIQRIQVLIQNRVINKVLGRSIHPTVPLPLKLFKWFPFLRRIPGYIVGMGLRAEHVKEG